MHEMMASARLMVIVAHDLMTIRDLCTTVLWMEHGQVRMQGRPDEVIDAYVRSVEGPAAAGDGRLTRGAAWANRSSAF